MLALLAACASDPADDTLAVPPPFPADPTDTSSPDAATTLERVAPSGSTAVVVSWEGVLGWWDGNNWVQVQGSVPLTGDETFRVHSVESAPGDATGSVPGPGCDLIPGAVSIRLSPALREGVPGAIGVTAPWPTDPHPHEAVDPDDEMRALVDDLVGGLGVEGGTEIVQLYAIDVDGDGSDERYGVAERSTNPALRPAEPGDHSVAFVVGPGGRADVLDAFVVTDPAVAELAVLRIGAFADIDHDEVDEIALGLTYAEGSGTRLVDRSTEGDHRVVLGNGCGV